MPPSPTVHNRWSGSRAARGRDSTDPAITARLNGISVNAACSGLRPRCCCSSKVANTPAELVVAVLMNDTSEPERRFRDRAAATGINGVTARRCCATKAKMSRTPAARLPRPTVRRPGRSRRMRQR